jgi:hypothetical protein
MAASIADSVPARANGTYDARYRESREHQTTANTLLAINPASVMDAATVLSIVTRVSVQLAHVIWFPINKLINLIIILLLPFYNVITFVLLPFIHLGQAIIRVLSIPFSVKWAERIEVLNPSFFQIYP